MSTKSKQALPAIATFEKVKRGAANQMENHMQNMTEQFEKFSSECVNRFEDVAQFNQQNLHAVIESAQVVAEGVKDINQLMTAHISQNLQNALNTCRAMLGIKNVRDLAELQNDYIKTCFDSLMAESTKISEVAVRCSSEAAEPLNARITSTVEKISERARKAA